MAGLSTITNGNFDSLCAAVPAPYGPLTRVDSVVATSPNSDLPITVTSALSVSFEISYDDLNDRQISHQVIRQAHQGIGQNEAVVQLAWAMDVLAAYADGYSAPPLTATETQTIYNILKQQRSLAGLNVWKGDEEVDGFEDTHVIASFTSVDGTDGTVTLTNTSTGDVDYALWDFNSGESTALLSDETAGAVTFDPIDGAGTYSVSLTVVGPYSVDRYTADVTVTGGDTPTATNTTTDGTDGTMSIASTVTPASPDLVVVTVEGAATTDTFKNPTFPLVVTPTDGDGSYTTYVTVYDSGQSAVASDTVTVSGT